MQKIFTIFFSALSISLLSQEYLNKTEKYDLELFNYLDSITVNNKIAIETYLEFSKPFSKWDIRPIKYEKIWALESIRTSSEVTNFFWGGFSQRYGLTEFEARDKPNQFLRQGQTDENSNITFLNDNINKFKTLVSLIGKSKNQLFLNQNTLQRIDNIFKENDSYWSFIIPDKSPFPISTKVKIEKKYNFDSLQKQILEKMIEINIYSIVKTENGIFFLIDGFTDNSYGFYFSKTKNIEMNSHLFEIMISKKIDDEFFYYIAN
ncbi:MULTISPECIES: hypothetical protein [Empedobacter]|uniref:Uncharacterized protein n=1 Tax=Empedobacter falsenii TaxID=343874 RepID=A0A7H9DU77_9FLAO|nr:MULTISPECIES: hypothetical protein [Empedobacter]MDH2206479.1 hypothetical protein [Empedobacter sp. GD03644]QLL58311.1 hypothetical protein FH779_09530 [Empedobacter falsenii]